MEARGAHLLACYMDGRVKVVRVRDSEKRGWKRARGGMRAHGAAREIARCFYTDAYRARLIMGMPYVMNVMRSAA